MNKRSDAGHDAISEAALADEEWQAFNLSLRRQAAASFKSAQQRRRWRKQVMLLAAAIAVIATGGGWWLSRRSAVSLRSHAEAGSSLPAGSIRRFTDADLLAMFPKGGCVFAEIDGRLELVLLDPELAARNFKFPDGAGQ